MKKLFTVFAMLFTSVVCLAQPTLSISNCSPTTVRPGSSTLICSLVLSGGNTSATGPAGLEGTLVASQTLGFPTIGVAGTAAAAGKIASIGNTGVFVIAGLNQNLIPDGIVATISIPIPAGVSCPGNSPCLNLSAVNTLGATAAGGAFAVAVGPSVTVSVSNFCDVNGDGVVNGVDFTAELSAAVAKTGGDRNGDGSTDVRDVQLVANAASGQACTATQ